MRCVEGAAHTDDGPLPVSCTMSMHHLFHAMSLVLQALDFLLVLSCQCVVWGHFDRRGIRMLSFSWRLVFPQVYPEMFLSAMFHSKHPRIRPSDLLLLVTTPA